MSEIKRGTVRLSGISALETENWAADIGGREGIAEGLYYKLVKGIPRSGQEAARRRYCWLSDQ